MEILILSKQYKRAKEYSQEFVESFKSELPINSRFINLEGKLFGKLKVIKYKDSKREHTNWFCKCDCGRYVVKKTNQLHRGVTSCTPCAFKEISDKNCLPKDVLYYKVTLRFPHLKLIDSKDGKVKSDWLWYCPLCNTPFHKSPYKLLHKDTHSCRCNTKAFRDWTTQLREFQIKQVCLSRGLKFLGWKDTYENNKSFLFVKCPIHQHYIINVNNLTHNTIEYGCPFCAEDTRGERFSHGLAKFLEDARYVHNDSFDYSGYEYVCSRTPSIITCNTCHGKFKASYDNHVNKKRGCPHCKGKNQKELYLLLGRDDDVPITLKYGIAKDTVSRLKEHEKNTGLSFEIISIIKFKESYSCKDAENKIKNIFGRDGYMGKCDFDKGYTETICCSKLDNILKVFKEIQTEEDNYEK